MTLPIIVTTYYGPTNYKGSRIKAAHVRDAKHTYSAWVPYPHEAHHGVDAHLVAAQALVTRLPFHNGAGVVEPVGHDSNHYYFIVKPPCAS